MKKLRIQKIYIIILSLIVIYVSVLSYYRHNIFWTKESDNIVKVSLVNDWLNSLKNNNFSKTISTASEILSKSQPYVPSPTYYYLARNAGINSNFFNPPFTRLDYEYWYNSLKINEIYKKLNIKNKQKLPELIFNLINKDVKTVETQKKNVFSYNTWKNKKGSLFEKYILLSDLLLQAGYNTQIISLYIHPKQQPVHILAEICDKNKNYYTCDFIADSFYYKSLSEISKDKSILKTWPVNWVKGLSYRLYKTEASALSYKKINQQLYILLSKTNKDIPVFGIDPEKRINYFMKNMGKIPDEDSFVLGIEPFFLIKRSEFFSKKWQQKNTNFTGSPKKNKN